MTAAATAGGLPAFAGAIQKAKLLPRQALHYSGTASRPLQVIEMLCKPLLFILLLLLLLLLPFIVKLLLLRQAI
jgi:hypothetical protein